MVLSQKCQYAVRAVFELAKQDGSAPVSAARIASLQAIPLRFLENILGELRQAGIVESVRGKEGGYRLNRRPRSTTVGEVIRVIQGPVEVIQCADEDQSRGSGPGRDGQGAGRRGCPLRMGCVLLPLWDRAHRAMMDVLDGTTFYDLVEQQRLEREGEVIDYAI